jgi:hypothetical protein
MCAKSQQSEEAAHHQTPGVCSPPTQPHRTKEPAGSALGDGSAGEVIGRIRPRSGVDHGWSALFAGQEAQSKSPVRSPTRPKAIDKRRGSGLLEGSPKRVPEGATRRLLP